MKDKLLSTLDQILWYAKSDWAKFRSQARHLFKNRHFQKNRKYHRYNGQFFYSITRCQRCVRAEQR